MICCLSGIIRKGFFQNTGQVINSGDSDISPSPPDTVPEEKEAFLMRIRLRGMHRSPGMVGRRIDGRNFQRCPSDVDDIVPGSRRYKDGVSPAHIFIKVLPVFTFSHLHCCPPLFNTDQLIGIFVDFRADLSAGGNAH